MRLADRIPETGTERTGLRNAVREPPQEDYVVLADHGHV